METTNNEFLSEEELSNEEFVDENLDENFEGFQPEDLEGSVQTPLGGLYGLFKEFINKPDSTKISNINKEELGNIGMSVRDCLHIALLGEIFGHKKFAKFFKSKSGIITDSAMSKDGWITELTVTSKRHAFRESSSSVKTLPQQSKGKWKMFTAKRQEGQR